MSADAKDEIRERVWRLLEERGVARFPGARGRIPNFAGAESAARRLAATEVFARARTLKCNPDLAQRPVRHAALRAGKRVFVAVPRLRAARPFLELDPARLGEDRLWRATSIEGAAALGRPVAVEELPVIDLVVAGSVAVASDGSRLGKGGGYSDLEFALAREAGRVGDGTPVVTTAHPLQVVAAGVIPMTAHDLPVDLVALPDEVMVCRGRFRRPAGILWDELPEARRREIPALASVAGLVRASAGPAPCSPSPRTSSPSRGSRA